jgi:PAS domain S-box-containing protein
MSSTEARSSTELRAERIAHTERIDRPEAGGSPSLTPDAAMGWFTAVLQTSRDAIIGKDINGFVTSWNNAAETMFGYTPEEIIGRSIRAIIPADRMDEETSLLERIASGGQVSPFETLRRHKNGTVIPVSLTVSPVRDRQGRIIGVCKIARDLSEMHLVRHELERREAQLRQAHKMEAIGRLAAGVAHDFNNVLQSMVNALELVLDDVAEGTTARKFTDIAITAAIRGASLTRRVLSYTREQSLHPKPIELGPFMRELQELLERTLGPHITFGIQLAGNPSVLADPGQLQTALLNLAINASEAMPLGGTLTMTASQEPEDGKPWTVIAFTDTGVGMDDATLGRAIDPFFTTKGASGNGLGLAMVDSFAEQSGGKLRIASVRGQGTTVSLSMPSPPLGPDRLDVPSTTAAAPRTGCRILLVDDLTDVLLTLTALLAGAGFVVTPADSGSQALSILAASGPFDVLITDFAMPGMNGAELITRCRAIQPGLRAVVITGFAEASFVDTLPKGTHVLRKPVRRNDLVEVVHGLMHHDQGREPISFDRLDVRDGNGGPARTLTARPPAG